MDAIILAAGKGTRMGGDLPKVAYEVAGRPMVWWVVQACRGAGVGRCIVVVGYGAEKVRQSLGDLPGCLFVEQKEQKGTGHAAQMAWPAFENESVRDVFVLAGDAPLIRTETLKKLLNVHRESGAAATLATSVLEEPKGYGRVIRAGDGSFDRIVEERDASPDQKSVREINPSYYCFRSNKLFECLGQVGNQNAQGEYYLTDVPGLLMKSGQGVSLVDAVPPEDVIGVNDPTQLAMVDRIMQERLAQGKAGGVAGERSKGSGANKTVGKEGLA